MQPEEVLAHIRSMVREVVREEIAAVATPGTVLLMRVRPTDEFVRFMNERKIAVVAECGDDVVGVMKG